MEQVLSFRLVLGFNDVRTASKQEKAIPLQKHHDTNESCIGILSKVSQSGLDVTLLKKFVSAKNPKNPCKKVKHRTKGRKQGRKSQSKDCGCQFEGRQ